MSPESASDFLKCSSERLDEYFSQASPGEIPDGEGTGTGLVWTGCFCSRIIAWFLRWFWWQGKVFDKTNGCLVNRITPFGFRGIKAKVYSGKSWFDGGDCIVIDYSQTSFVARFVRDEIREITPGLYLGQVFLGRKRIFHFSISFRYQPERKFWRRVWSTAAVAMLGLTAYLAVRFTRDEPVVYADDEEHFKYGSTGGERAAGIPYVLWKLLPEMFPEFLPGPGLQSLGFLYEPGHELPIGVSKRNVQGIDRVFLNCAICHVGSVRETPDSEPRYVAGMPSNTVDLQGFERFLFACAVDEKFNPTRILLELDRIEPREDFLNRAIIRLVAVNLMRDRMLFLRQRFSFMDREPDCGPGRVDTFNPPKVLLNFPMDKIPTNEWIGLCDFPSVWNQRQREGMQLHWDGNNTSVQERNRSAAFGTGATPPTLDRASIRRVEDWLYDEAKPPPFPFPVDSAKLALGKRLYAEYCLRCHGVSGSDFTGELVGKVTPIEDIQTDRWRLDSYSQELAANQNLLYAAFPEERFKHFRKTFGYANQPLDGLWLRAPYLHNGSVPTLRDLLEPAERRPETFYRGYDVIDPVKVGFISNVSEENGRNYFLFDTRLPGNGNDGHEGPAYGTDLSAGDKDALVEYLKTF